MTSDFLLTLQKPPVPFWRVDEPSAVNKPYPKYSQRHAKHRSTDNILRKVLLWYMREKPTGPYLY
jgi:hypothetical protein